MDGSGLTFSSSPPAVFVAAPATTPIDSLAFSSARRARVLARSARSRSCSRCILFASLMGLDIPSGPRDGLVGLAGPADALLSILEVDASSSPDPRRSPSWEDGRRFIPPASRRRAAPLRGRQLRESF